VTPGSIGNHFQVVDTRSGQLLVTRSFENTFSQLQFAGENLVYLLHRGSTAQGEIIELHQFNIASGQDQVMTQFRHVTDAKVRPTQWRGSFSPNGTFLAYQENVLKPVVTLVDPGTGQTISQVQWEGDYTALPVHFHPTRPLVAIPLARWDGNRSYSHQRRLLVADTVTGAILGQFEHENWINQVHFSEDGLVILSEPHVGTITFGYPNIAWKSYAEAIGPSGHQQFFLSEGLINRCVRRAAGERTDVVLDLSQQRWQLDDSFLPVGLRGDMFVSEQHHDRRLPSWMITVNQKVLELLGCYLLSPITVRTRYQDARTGKLRYELQQDPGTPEEAASLRIAGKRHLTLVYLREKGLVVKVFTVSPFWTTWKLVAFAIMLTVALCMWRNRSRRLSRQNRFVEQCLNQ
jgi:hypothetical protein